MHARAIAYICEMRGCPDVHCGCLRERHSASVNVGSFLLWVAIVVMFRFSAPLASVEVAELAETPRQGTLSSPHLPTVLPLQSDKRPSAPRRL